MTALPWSEDKAPLMLAPMQGLTNDALRAFYHERYSPDVVFTEFIRVQAQSRKRITRADLAEIEAHSVKTPLVVQLIGHTAGALADAAKQVQDAGCRHLNLNLGCPYGRMTTGATGGELLREPGKLAELLTALRRSIQGSFSVKCRAGYTDSRQLLELLPLYVDSGIDYLIIHPRTVIQKYTGLADHELTAEVASRTKLPIIANGDINNAPMGRKLLQQTDITGLMLGRGALADPWIFQRIRGNMPDSVDEAQRRSELFEFLSDLLPLYLVKFCGERQSLMKLKDLLNFIPDECLQRDLGKLKRATTVERFLSVLNRRFPR
ncbi:tRNA-dihydrouridine synthase family protein [uncultured Desulfuromusa sp.]|uniref:tRNA dihydrouridine synthase n=1 Tax=uncultured Desulfuromusa sp. TaxID=219183 RepID=UPI002AA67F52|nr:tRNA-dihydrouridine synthase family protein [uncultured Desulfuromusa sp.]